MRSDAKDNRLTECCGDAAVDGRQELSSVSHILKMRWRGYGRKSPVLNRIARHCPALKRLRPDGHNPKSYRIPLRNGHETAMDNTFNPESCSIPLSAATCLRTESPKPKPYKVPQRSLTRLPVDSHRPISYSTLPSLWQRNRLRKSTTLNRIAYPYAEVRAETLNRRTLPDPAATKLGAKRINSNLSDILLRCDQTAEGGPRP